MKVMVFGTFDIIHPGHLNFFAQAKKRGEYLIVVGGRDETIKEVKGRYPKNREKQRLSALKELEIVDKAVMGNLTPKDRPSGHEDKYLVIKEYKPDIICLGYDQKFFIPGLKKWIKNNKLNIKVYKIRAYKPQIYKTSLIMKR